MSHATWKLTYLKGLDKNIKPEAVDVTLDNVHQCFEITFGDKKITLPLTDLTGSKITTETEVPPEDDKNEYVYYLTVFCFVNGEKTELVFSKKQKQYVEFRSILALDYVIKNLDETLQKNHQRSQQLQDRQEQ